MRKGLGKLREGLVARITEGRETFVGAIEEGFARAKLARVEIKTSLALSMVPNYVAYKAVLIREKMLLQHICAGLGIAAVSLFICGRWEVSRLQERLRSKEYILAPGVTDFIPVAPQSVPDAYIQHAVSDFVDTLANTNPMNIEERFSQLSRSMSPGLQIQFATEAREWIAKAKSENISEMTTILEKRIESDDSGKFRAHVQIRIDSFIGGESIGYRNEVIEMRLQLVPPDVGRHWFLEITELSRSSQGANAAAVKLGGISHGK